MQRFVGAAIVYTWVLATALPSMHILYCCVRFHRLAHTHSLTPCIPHSALIILRLVHLSLFYYRFPQPNCIFLFTSICSKHDFKLPEIAYFFLNVLLLMLLLWCRCCFNFFSPFHSIFVRGSFRFNSVYIKVIAKSVYRFLFCFWLYLFSFPEPTILSSCC